MRKTRLLIIAVLIGSFFPINLGLAADYLDVPEGTIKTFKIDKYKIIVNKKSYDAFGSLDDRSYSTSAKVLKTRMLSGKKVTPRVWGSGFIEYIHTDKIGQYVLAIQKSSDVEPKIYESKEYYIKFPIKVGTTWETEESTYLLKAKNIPIDCTNTIETLNDIVTVREGTFENCMRIKCKGEVIMKGGYRTSIEGNHWYAPKIGWIKSIVRHFMSEREPVEQTIVLTRLEKQKISK